MPTDLSVVKPASQPGNPSWATNGGTRVAPTLGQKQSGWTDGQRPPFNVMNWLQGFLSDWAKYAEDAIDELDSDKLSRHGLNAFDGDLKPDANAVRSLGDGTHRLADIFTDTLDVSGEIDASGASFVDFSGASVLTATLSVGTGVATNLVPTVDAKDLGSTTKRWDLFADDIRVYGDLFPNADDSATIELGTPSLRWRGNLSRVAINEATYGTPITATATTTAVTNYLCRRNICKAWAIVLIDGTTHNVTVMDGFNIASASLDPGSGTISCLKVLWAGDFSSSFYAAIATADIMNSDTAGVSADASNEMLMKPIGNDCPDGGLVKSNGQCSFKAIKVSDGTQIDLDARAIDQYISVFAFGAQ